MRVGISLLTLSPGDGGGSETYARQLTRALGRVGTHEYMVLVPARAKDAAEGLPAVEVKDPPVARRGPLRIATMALAARRTKAVTTQVAEFDVLHYPLTVPSPGTQAPTIVTLHDTQHRDLPEFFGPARRSFRRIAYDRAARSAAAVIVTSEFVRGRAVELLDLDPGRVHVVPHAIDHSVFRLGDDEPEPILLYPARPWPHKNHTRLLEAFATLRETRPQLRLVLTGGGLDRLEPLPEGVENLGSVSAEHLASLYRRAACLVYPEPVRGLRAAGPRGDGVRMSRRRVQRGRDPGGRRRCRRALRPDRRGRDGRRDARGGQPARGAHDPRPHPRRAATRGTRAPGATTTSIARPL